MSGIGEYRTKQRTAILQYFKAHPHAHLTAEELSDALRATGISVGKSTVYRALEKFVESGVVRRFSIAPGESACYQYAGGLSDTCHAHFHLKCTVCGTLSATSIASASSSSSGREVSSTNSASCERCAA